MCLELNTGFPGGSDSKASVYNVGDPGSIPGSGRSPGEGNGSPAACGVTAEGGHAPGPDAPAACRGECSRHLEFCMH